MILFERVIHFIERHHLLHTESTVIIGLSGGPDSVFLLYFLHYYLQQKRIKKLIAAHLDHQWRADSEKDALFCKQLCEKLTIDCVIEKAENLPASLKKGSKEEQGRKMRRYFLERATQQYGTNVIALGHHADDQKETFFIRLIRGTTLSGLTGMKPHNGFYIRPLLEIHKKEIIEYLQKHILNYVIDPTNQSPSFLRNNLRLGVLPLLTTIDQRFDKNFFKTLKHLRETDNFLQEIIKKTFHEIAHKKDETWFIVIKKLFLITPFLQKQIILYWLINQNISFNISEPTIAEIERFLRNSKNKTHQLYQTWSIIKEKHHAFIMQHKKFDTTALISTII